MTNKEVYSTVRGYQIKKRNTKLLTDSMEDYLEMIYRQCLKEGYTRVSTLANELNVQASSASKMVQRLTHLKLLNYQKYGIIHLSEKGKLAGEFLLYRHDTIRSFLELLDLDNNLLAQIESLEHTIEKDTLKKLNLLVRFFHEDPALQEKFILYINNRV